ncbi:hypothetical protein BC834DRAFT_1034862 [Gloeopeniophorella convolvens]|nr:hypothetical protein BC834DRAFT_1034862 [Gloeopeniophorella convolvens]
MYNVANLNDLSWNNLAESNTHNAYTAIQQFIPPKILWEYWLKQGSKALRQAIPKLYKKDRWPVQCPRTVQSLVPEIQGHAFEGTGADCIAASWFRGRERTELKMRVDSFGAPVAELGDACQNRDTALLFPVDLSIARQFAGFPITPSRILPVSNGVRDSVTSLPKAGWFKAG